MNTVAPFVGLAVRVRDVRQVPAGCFGLSWLSGSAGKYLAGNSPSVRSEGALWWVNPRPRSLRFAPDPLAPEAGLCIEIAPRPGFEHALASWLASLVDLDEIGEVQLVWALRHRAAEALKQAMLPCLQRQDLARARVELSESLRMAMGMECTALFRIDMAQEQELAHAETCAFGGVKGQKGEQERAERHTRVFEASEAYAERRFFKELPELSAQIERRRHLPGTPDDEESYARARNLAQLSQMLAKSYAARRPVISAATIPAEVIQLLLLASQQATAGLDAAWAILATENDPPGMSREQINRLEAALQQLQLQLERRFAPWWETES